MVLREVHVSDFDPVEVLHYVLKSQVLREYPNKVGLQRGEAIMNYGVQHLIDSSGLRVFLTSYI